MIEENILMSSVYSIFTQITLGNILSYPILFMQILFLIPDYPREDSDRDQYILSSIKIILGNILN